MVRLVVIIEIVCVFAAFHSKLYASDSGTESSLFNISGQIRHRSEVDGRSFVPDSRLSNFHLLRSRLNINAHPADNVIVFIQVQDSRAFGNGVAALGRGTMDGSAKALDFHQAYFTIDKIFDLPVQFRIGRQELIYGNERLVGAVGWHNIGRTFDGLEVSHRTSATALRAFAAKLTEDREENGAEYFYGLYNSFFHLHPHTIHVFLLYDENTSIVNKLNRFTAGFYVHSVWKKFNYEIEYAHQAGSGYVSAAETEQRIHAYMASGKAGYLLNSNRDLKFSLLYTILSGENESAGNKIRSFNTLFATNHKFYGFMDYFPGINRNQGLKNLGVSLSANILSDLSVYIDYHHFNPYKKGTSGGHFGQEVDLTLLFKYNSAVSFQLGSSMFFPGESIRESHGDSNTHWSYIMTVINF